MKLETQHNLDTFDTITINGNGVDLSLTTCGTEGLNLQLNDANYKDIVFDEFTLKQSLDLRNFLIKAYPISFKTYILNQLDRIFFKKEF